MVEREDISERVSRARSQAAEKQRRRRRMRFSILSDTMAWVPDGGSQNEADRLTNQCLNVKIDQRIGRDRDRDKDHDIGLF